MFFNVAKKAEISKVWALQKCLAWWALAPVAPDGVDALLAAGAGEAAGAALVDVFAALRFRIDLEARLNHGIKVMVFETISISIGIGIKKYSKDIRLD